MSSPEETSVPHPPSPVHEDYGLHRERRIPVLDFLDYIFKALAVVNRAYTYMFPAPHPPDCQHTPHQQGTRHLTDMAGQGGRMAFVGMLLRTTERILDFHEDSHHYDECLFASIMKQEDPEIAHSVAVLNFLTAGLCNNDTDTVFGLLHLVQALKWASKSCEHHHCDVNFIEFYKSNKRNCTLALVKKLLDQCTEAKCDTTCEVCQEIQRYKADLEPHLDPRHWTGCADCEAMIVDILVYSATYFNTERRMMASLRLSLNCPINVEQNLETLKQLQWLPRYLRHEGFTEIQHNTDASQGKGFSVDYEVLFMSGWQRDKKMKEPMHLMLEAFLERKSSRRLFFIQWKHQFIGDDGLAHCCEPQIMDLLKEVIPELAKHCLSQFIKVHMMLEQDPCDSCRGLILPVILTQLGDFIIPPQLVSMLPYIPRSVFLKRLTEAGGPVQLKEDLELFEERNACMVHKRCKHVRCHKHCHYSKTSKVITVREEKIRHHRLQISLEIQKHPKPNPIMWFVWCDT